MGFLNFHAFVNAVKPLIKVTSLASTGLKTMHTLAHIQ
jgi:hypothetical protein